jgi:hypothetical protein
MRILALLVALLSVPAAAAALTPWSGQRTAQPPERAPAASPAESADVAMPPILVGRWAPLCGSPEGERGGVTIHSNGRMDANDGSETCWIESLGKFNGRLLPDRLGEWQIAGRCQDSRTQSEIARRFEGVMWLQDLAGRHPRLYRTEGSCFRWGARDCKYFVSMSKCEPGQIRSVSPISP